MTPRNNVKMRPAESWESFNNDSPGTIRRVNYWVASGDPAPCGYAIRCPGCNLDMTVTTHDPPSGPDGRAKWTETGSLEEGNLSIMPSIWHQDESCGWHGFLTDGEFRSI